VSRFWASFAPKPLGWVYLSLILLPPLLLLILLDIVVVQHYTKLHHLHLSMRGRSRHAFAPAEATLILRIISRAGLIISIVGDSSQAAPTRLARR
jgi:cytochrome c oxidase subunit IV